MNDITAVQRDSANGDGFTYDLTQEIVGFQREATSINLSTGTVTGGTPNNMLFDGCGNRTTLNNVNQTFNNMNQPTGTGIAYSSKGNLITYNGWTYGYDAQNRLTNATNGTTTASFYYDGLNRQIARSINNVKTFSVWDDWELIEEYGTGNVRTAAYLQGAHGPVKSLLNNIYFYQDELGSTSHIASSTGALLEYYKYDLYGKPHYFDPNNNNQELTASNFNVRDLFSGERWIPEISLYDLRNRFMSPDTGRFLQPDPIGFKGDSSNLYRYCGNDWANRTDPMGLTSDAGADPVDQVKLRNSEADKLGIEKYQQLMRSMQSLSVGQQNLQPQYRYSVPNPDPDRQPHRVNDKEGGGATFRWQGNEYYPNSKTLKPIKEPGWGNKEIEVSRTGNIGKVKTTPKGIMALSKNGILSDYVAPFVQDPGGAVHGTVTLRNETYERVGNVWQYRGPATTQFTHTYDRDANGAWHVDSQISKE